MTNNHRIQISTGDDLNRARIRGGFWVLCFFTVVLFFSWYTSFGEPLTEEEIAAEKARRAAAARVANAGGPPRALAWNESGPQPKKWMGRRLYSFGR